MPKTCLDMQDIAPEPYGDLGAVQRAVEMGSVSRGGCGGDSAPGVISIG